MDQYTVLVLLPRETQLLVNPPQACASPLGTRSETEQAETGWHDRLARC